VGMPPELRAVDAHKKDTVGISGRESRAVSARPGTWRFMPPLLLRLRIVVELAEQRIAVLRGPVGQLQDEVLNLFPAGLSERLGAAEVDGVGLYQFGSSLCWRMIWHRRSRTLGPVPCRSHSRFAEEASQPDSDSFRFLD